MTYAVGNLIIEPDLIAQYNIKCHNTVTNLASWWTGNIPDGVFPQAEVKQRDSGGPSDGEIKAQDPTISQYEITADYIAAALVVWSKRYTSTRKCRYQRWRKYDGWGSWAAGSYWYIDNGSPIAVASMVNLTYLQPGTYASFDAVAAATSLVTGTQVTIGDVTGFDSYLNSLFNAWNAAKENMVTVDGYYCHSSCHGNCHWSRGGR